MHCTYSHYLYFFLVQVSAIVKSFELSGEYGRLTIIIIIIIIILIINASPLLFINFNYIIFSVALM